MRTVRASTFTIKSASIKSKSASTSVVLNGARSIRLHEPLFWEQSLTEIAETVGMRRVHIIAWRDLDDPEAGGSELHAHRIATLWADAGIQVTTRTSAVVDQRSTIERSGYKARRSGGRYSVFPRAALEAAYLSLGQIDGLVEIWNGMPFLSPLWAHVPKIVFLHHVHAEMWRMTLPTWLARIGELTEQRLAPLVYRGTRIVTLSESSRAEIASMLKLPLENIVVVPPGVDERFSPLGPGSKTGHPLLLAVGRLVPVKRFELLLDVFSRLHERYPELEALIVGEGYKREFLQNRIDRLGAAGWIKLLGRVEDDNLVELYRRAWVLVSTSLREGWGMTVTEAAACGTPAVVTNIAGHADAVVDGETGFLVEDTHQMVDRVSRLIEDELLRRRMGAAAADRASQFTWEATAKGALIALAEEALAKQRGSRHTVRKT